jgi:hypothetical protein
LPAALVTGSLVLFTRRRFARRAAHCIARFFLLPTSCPPRWSLHLLFLSPAGDLPAAPLAASLVSFSCQRLARRAVRCIVGFFLSSMFYPPRRSLHRSFLSLANDLSAAPLAASLVSFSSRRLARRAVRCIVGFFLSSMFCPQRRSLHRSFLSLANVLPAAPLAASLVSFSSRRLARRAARCIARFFTS